MDSLLPVSLFKMVFAKSLSDQKVAVINLDRHVGQEIVSGISFVSMVRSHFPHRIQTNLCFVFSSRSFISSMTPFSMLSGVAENFAECSRIGLANSENSSTSN